VPDADGSRLQQPAADTCLRRAGCRVVVAETYARIFFRNCIATGELYPCEVGSTRICDQFETGEEAEVDMEDNVITRLRDGKRFEMQPLGEAAPVIDAGGLFEYARREGMIASAA
jgi:3-isopropylmalate/(R)-2-methylmalate dehydratase small subunit